MSSIYGIPNNLIVFDTVSDMADFDVSNVIDEGGKRLGYGNLVQVNTVGLYQYLPSYSTAANGTTIVNATPTGVWVEYFLATGQTYIAIDDEDNSIIGAAISDIPLANTHIFVGNSSGVATDVAMSGDATISNAGAVTIANNAVTTAKINNSAVTLAKLAPGITPAYILSAAGTGSYAGGSATATFTVSGLTAGDLVLAQIATSANAVSVQKVSFSGTTVSVLCSGDPGASTFTYHVARAAS